MAKTFFNPEDLLADPQSAFDLFAQSAKAAAPFSTLDNPGYRKAIVIERGAAMSAEEAKGFGIGPSSRRMISYKYMVRLCDDWNEHMLLPNPCDPATSTSRNIDMGPCHLMVVGSQDTQFGTTVSINVGDYVDVDMEKGNFLKDLQKARHGNMTSRPSGRGHKLSCPGTVSYSRKFGSMAVAPNVTAVQQAFTAALIAKYGAPLAVNSYFRTPADQVRAMMGLAVAELNSNYKGGPLEPASQLIIQAKSKTGPEKDDLILKATELIRTHVDDTLAAGRTVGSHLGGRAIDVATRSLTEAEVDDLRAAIQATGGKVYLEPTQSKCWNQPRAGDPATYGTGVLSRGGEVPGKGKCAGEHMHIDIPGGWAQPTS